MTRKKKPAVVRCWVCGEPATREECEPICDNIVCEGITRLEVKMAVMVEKEQQEHDRGQEV